MAKRFSPLKMPPILTLIVLLPIAARQYARCAHMELELSWLWGPVKAYLDSTSWAFLHKMSFKRLGGLRACFGKPQGSIAEGLGTIFSRFWRLFCKGRYTRLLSAFGDFTEHSEIYGKNIRAGNIRNWVVDYQRFPSAVCIDIQKNKLLQKYGNNIWTWRG